MDNKSVTVGKIWKLHVGVGNKYCFFIPHDLRFFENRFHCKPLVDHWQIPPVEVGGRSKAAADFLIWMAMAPVVSERARDLIDDLVGVDVEFLPFHNLKRRRYFVMNVLRCEDYLDLKQSDFNEFRERFVFKPNLPASLPPIFKCRERWGEIFVSSHFAEMMVSNKLRGAQLADPAVPTMPLILAKEAINRYPGLDL